MVVNLVTVLSIVIPVDLFEYMNILFNKIMFESRNKLSKNNLLSIKVFLV